MTERTVRLSLLVVAVSVAVALTIFLLNKPSSDGPRIRGILADFMKCLPSDLTEQQRGEIEDILSRYDRVARAGSVSPDKRIEILNELRRHVAAGTINKDELYRFMALVSASLYDVDVEHPLLEDEEADSLQE